MTDKKRTILYFKDKEILDYLNSKDNKSKYLSDLIRAEMKQNKPITREEIMQMIQQYCGKPVPKDEAKEEIIKSSIDKLLKPK